MTKIQMLFLASESDEIGEAADEYRINVSRGDGLPMTEAEVNVALTTYMLKKYQAQMAAGRTDGLARRQPEANSTDAGKRTAMVDGETVASSIEVIHVHEDIIDEVAKLPKNTAMAWRLAVAQLKPSPGAQVVIIQDEVAAAQLVAAGLVTPHTYRGQICSGQFVISRTKAFCSVKPVQSTEGMFNAPILAIKPKKV